MKIYVSEKDFDTCNEKIVTFNDVDLALYDKKWDAYDIVETIERGAVIKSLEQHNKELLQEFCISLLKDIDYSNYEEKLFIEDYLEPRIKNLLKERGVE